MAQDSAPAMSAVLVYLAPLVVAVLCKRRDVVYLDLLGQPMVIINSFDAASKILEGRSENTSDRPRIVIAEWTGFMWEFAIHGYSQGWRQQSRAFHKFFHPNRLLDAPDNFGTLARHAFSETIMIVAYEITVKEHDDPYVSTAERAAVVFSSIAAPGRYLVELLPSLKYLPPWLSGAGFKRDARRWRADVLAVPGVSPQLTTSITEMDGTARSSMVTTLIEGVTLEGCEVTPEDEDCFRDVAGLAYPTGADTTMFSTQAFFLAMCQHSSAQMRAQAKLDIIVRPERLPEFSDRAELPYVCALVREVVRWHSVVPFGVSHRTIDEDEYEGYRIPAGTAIVPNARAMPRDPTIYPEPDKFMPERFIDVEGRATLAGFDSQKFQFGFGRGCVRRSFLICPGRHFAPDALFITVASLLHVFDIERPLYETGRPCPTLEPGIVLEYFLSYGPPTSEPFACMVVPRSKHAEELIRNAGHLDTKI
ncbi:O-methylsterigmatocystin oxidoreductase [Trametes elegans]|nr:O-methylsterigmatocystin oxidoreductase [Trametes elegans]